MLVSIISLIPLIFWDWFWGAKIKCSPTPLSLWNGGKSALYYFSSQKNTKICKISDFVFANVQLFNHLKKVVLSIVCTLYICFNTITTIKTTCYSRKQKSYMLLKKLPKKIWKNILTHKTKNPGCIVLCRQRIRATLLPGSSEPVSDLDWLVRNLLYYNII